MNEITYEITLGYSQKSRLKKMSQKILLHYSLPAIILSTLLVVAIIYAWTEPTVAPPGGNVPAPLNVGTTTQHKAGALGIGGVFRGHSNAIFDGNVGIGTTTPATRLHVEGTARMTGFQLGTTATPSHVLTANAAGVGTWQAVAAGITRCQPTGFQYNSICSTPRLLGDAPCPIWRDCDGDGRTYGAGDCDESCPTCFVGSLTITPTPDNRDQNCDGLIDNIADVTLYRCHGHDWTDRFRHGVYHPPSHITCRTVCNAIGFPEGAVRDKRLGDVQPYGLARTCPEHGHGHSWNVNPGFFNPQDWEAFRCMCRGIQ